ncbi:hypothetical protein SARC_08402 [Sphaeroforma arctica JP610]|uniref:30S ribosomal protein S18 n=1 Tax=Sphaeroforma arctica JP610 TaxID=667725 RepID=A0A0L0FQZ6_9EUKA|nr:hypothetical protein SARC_08402 [Sphaeroforma arctica JP610]KNC79190.1 hypothetical protein SARC_08402 [Sphaeroforma arctica JP610]|eukprot:XP_014153092.1 hypothetical protein SARC_08402 [Sphaeroforma arctica JP610]
MNAVTIISRATRGARSALNSEALIAHRVCYTTDSSSGDNNTRKPPPRTTPPQSAAHGPNSAGKPNQATPNQPRPSPFFKTNSPPQQGNAGAGANPGNSGPRKFTQFPGNTDRVFNRPQGGAVGGVQGGSVSFSNPARAFVPPGREPGAGGAPNNFNLQNRGGFNQKVGTQGNPGAGPGGYAYSQRSAQSNYQAPSNRPGLGPPAVTRANGGVANKRYIKVQEKKSCPICSNEVEFDFRHVNFLSQFVTEHSGMILPARLTGVCAKQQRKLAKCIKRSRAMGLMSFTGPTPGIADNLPRMG